VSLSSIYRLHKVIPSSLRSEGYNRCNRS